MNRIARWLLTLTRLPRAARGALIALGLALVVAAPAAAAQPTRIVIDVSGTTKWPAGTFCDFAVTSYRPLGSRLTIWDFSDGREALVGNMVRRTYTNDATGTTFVLSTTAHEVDRFDTDTIRGVVTGQFAWQFLPGDVGPDGVVLDHLLELYIQGQATYVLDSTTFATLEITIEGTATDICAAIS